MYKRIKELREQNNLKQINIAKELKTTREYYSRYENGQIPITVERLIKLAELYNTSIDYIVGLTDIKKPYPKN